MYIQRHKSSGRVSAFLRDDQNGKVSASPAEDYENVYVPDVDPEDYLMNTLGSLSPEADKGVGVPYLIDDISNPPSQCPPQALVAIDQTMDSPDFEHKLGSRILRCMPVERTKSIADALEEIIAEDNLPDQANMSVATIRRAIARARGKTRRPGSVIPKP